MHTKPKDQDVEEEISGESKSVPTGDPDELITVDVNIEVTVPKLKKGEHFYIKKTVRVTRPDGVVEEFKLPPQKYNGPKE